MVIEGSNFLPRANLDENTETGSILKQEVSCFKQSLTLDTIPLSRLNAKLFMACFYPLLIAISILTITFLFSLLGSVKTMEVSNFLILYLILITYCFLGGFAYMSYLKNNNVRIPYLSYVYVCMYSLTYLPMTLAFSMILGAIGSIFMFALVLVTQYWISNCMLNGYDFESNKQRFLFSIITTVIQFIFLLSVEAFVSASIMKAKIQ